MFIKDSVSGDVYRSAEIVKVGVVNSSGTWYVRIRLQGTTTDINLGNGVSTKAAAETNRDDLLAKLTGVVSVTY